ncbi:sugar ABC transporter ATP-binding protein [Vibrio sp. JC009]|uniref:sugar ABC transporter ATP-binding protein n=1 Tax=Vibrio sp. JC009 TaxID=2912314 RepID=UPI0023B0BFA3|nr:sugar ABC transporter ATP-binding protein [Vibrio sp. JC009]WED23608.1 sugar ABC transporter ATP-binding protein [Vibrio sp. JC009]
MTQIGDTHHSAPPVLEMKNVSKTFPGVKALQNVKLTVYPSEVHSLMGENGAGKSTLMKILSGAYHADKGSEIFVNGNKVNITDPLAAKKQGIAVIYQELSLAPNLSIAENIFLGSEISSNGLADRRTMEAQSQQTLDRLGVTFSPKTLVSELSIAEQQMIEIARAVHANAQILVMDEPTTALSTRETNHLFELIHRLREEGLAIIYISHRMSEIYELSDRCSVLRDGTYVGTLMREDLSSEALVKMMVGRDISGFYKKDHQECERADKILEVKDLSDGNKVKPNSFSLYKGEVLAIAGLVGSGRTELARLIFGADDKASGEVFLNGEKMEIKKPKDAIDQGILYLTEDRKSQGLFLDMDVCNNTNLLAFSQDCSPSKVLNLKRRDERAKSAIKSLNIRVPHARVAAGSLSGGNQQKVLLSRLLEVKPKVLILDEPTRGVDIGAKSEIYKIINELVKNGVGVLVISSELPEVIGIADRVLVMHEGHIAGELDHHGEQEMNQNNIMKLAAGA